jgi:hypothetical protein
MEQQGYLAVVLDDRFALQERDKVSETFCLVAPIPPPDADHRWIVRIIGNRIGLDGLVKQDFHFGLPDDASIRQAASADAGVLEILDSEGVPESMDGRYRLSRVSENRGNQRIFDGSLDTSPALPRFSQNLRLSVPIFTLLAPAAPRSCAPCFRTAGASDGSPPASASRTGRAY